jgi:hypothetical protein
MDKSVPLCKGLSRAPRGKQMAARSKSLRIVLGGWEDAIPFLRKGAESL